LNFEFRFGKILAKRWGGKKISESGSFWYRAVVRRRRVIIVLAVCVLVGIGVVAFWPGEREPEYNGKKLSEWLDSVCVNLSLEQASALLAGNFAEIKSKTSLEAIQAIRCIGTNAVPWFVRWNSREPRPPWKKRLLGIYWKLPRILQNSSVERRLLDTGDWRGGQAMIGFVVLGPDAAPAIPELLRIAKHAKSGDTQLGALVCLGLLGETARPALPYLKGYLDERMAQINIHDPHDILLDGLGKQILFTIESIEPGNIELVLTNRPVKTGVSGVLTNRVKDF
jgi:hypothetical protein